MITSLPSSVAAISLPPVMLYVRSSPSTSSADRLKLPDKSSSKLRSDTLANTEHH